MPTTHGRSASPSRSQWTALTTGQVPIVGLLLVHQRTCPFEKALPRRMSQALVGAISTIHSSVASHAHQTCAPGANQRPGSESLLKLAYQTATR